MSQDTASKMLNKRLLFVVDLIAILGQAYSAPAAASSQEDSITLELGIKFDKRSDSLPTLTLPYSTYQAASYDSTSDVRVQYLLWEKICSISSVKLTILLDIYVHEHPLCSASPGRSAVGSTRCPCYEYNSPRWQLWQYVCAG